MSERGVEIRWYGASSVELVAEDGTLAIDPHVSARGEAADVVCVSREDHDHCDLVALRELAGEDGAGLVVVPKSCTLMHQLDAPLCEPDGDLSFVPEERLVVLHPRYARFPKDGVENAVEASGYLIEAVQSSDREPSAILDRWQRYRSPNWTNWPQHDGAFVGMGELAPQGYVVTHVRSGATVYHPGDLQEVFDFHYDLRGRIDLMLLPVGPLGGLELSIVDAVRPRAVMPVHYRPSGDAGDWPSAEDYPAVDLGTGYPTPDADAEEYRTQYRSLIDLRWYPSPEAPFERLEGLRDELEELGATLVIPQAGEAVRLP
jgi:L-ascorbate metabolism protein UlaG (beta-lactamase superfamily)